MISKETRLQRINRLNTLKEELKKRYEVHSINGEEYYKSGKGNYFHPELLTEWGCIVLEYGDMEDGDLFYLEDLTDEELLKAVIQEAEM